MNSILPLSTRLDGRAETFENASSQQLDAARNDARAAEQNAAAAALHTAGAAANVVVAAADSARGAVDTVSSAGHLAAAGGLATEGASAWLDEKVRTASRFAATEAAKGFAHLANALGDGGRVSVRQQPSTSQGPRESAVLFGEAHGQLTESKQAAENAAGAYGDGALNLAGAAVNGVLAGAHAVAAVGDAGAAVQHADTAADLEAAAATMRLAAAGARDARAGAIWGAKAAAAVANTVGNDDEPKAKVVGG
jgi:hypothetical protein